MTSGQGSTAGDKAFALVPLPPAVLHKLSQGSLFGAGSHVRLQRRLFSLVLSNRILCTYNARILYRIFISTVLLFLFKNNALWLLLWTLLSPILLSLHCAHESSIYADA